MTITPQQVQEAAEYLQSGGLAEVMHALQMAAIANQPVAKGDTAMLMALCAMAAMHIQTRNPPPPRQPVRMQFGRLSNRRIP